MRLQRSEPPALFDGFEAARSFFASCFQAGGTARERLWVAHVDSAARCLHVAHYDGELESVRMPVREIMIDAARLGSAGLVLAHNHPSGEARPSKADCLATGKLARAAEAFDLTILDHLIFAAGDCSSMRRMGLL